MTFNVKPMQLRSTILPGYLCQTVILKVLIFFSLFKGGVSMKVTELLIKEHDLIRRFLVIQWESIKKLKEDIRPSKLFFEQSVKFIRNFADKFHHIKEEEIMFRHLAAKKNGELDAKVEMLKQQHDRGRDYVSQINGSLDQYEKGAEIATENVIVNLASYYSLLSRHIHIEDYNVYPLIEEIFTDDYYKIKEFYLLFHSEFSSNFQIIMGSRF